MTGKTNIPTEAIPTETGSISSDRRRPKTHCDYTLAMSRSLSLLPRPSIIIFFPANGKASPDSQYTTPNNDGRGRKTGCTEVKPLNENGKRRPMTVSSRMKFAMKRMTSVFCHNSGTVRTVRSSPTRRCDDCTFVVPAPRSLDPDRTRPLATVCRPFGPTRIENRPERTSARNRTTTFRRRYPPKLCVRQR